MQVIQRKLFNRVDYLRPPELGEELRLEPEEELPLDPDDELLPDPDDELPLELDDELREGV